ncbi:MAG: PSD1 and planctomycete cytochrome C domain-containing protein [Planctomycetota bacterium]|nr:PSD1 and planctomycete cytochrome C domain-containing protein [Planctomycetota bacterium]
MLLRLPLALALSLLLLGSVRAADDQAGIQFFETHIRPVLVAKCYECHSSSSKEPKGNLLLDSREGIRMGGESGKAVVPGDLEDSVLLEAIRWEGLEMPPDEQLPAETIARFEQWIKMGAQDPRDEKSAPIRRQINFEKAREFWAFQPIENPQPPATKSKWARTDVDHFIAEKHESRGLTPTGDASVQTLVRRIYFDLIGLPPTPEQSAAFQQAARSNVASAVETLVDELLASPHFGERWGRHWMDVVRYGESTGMERNATFPYAWRYRDWVIAALNDDKSFDRFVKEQVAGDLMPYDSPEQRKDQVMATAFLAIGPKSLNETDREAFAMDVVDEQIDVTTRAFIGLTASCARCHDHKFDPVPQKEYYALAGIFRSTETYYGTDASNGNRHPSRLLSIAADGTVAQVSTKGTGKGTSQAAVQKKLKAERANLKRFIAQLAKNPDARGVQIQKEKSEATINQLSQRVKQQNETVVDAKDGEQTMAVLDGDSPDDTQLRLRGEPGDRGDTIPRGFLTIGSVGHIPELDRSTSGRLALAEWLTQDDNPLTARVAVNRVWQHLFGRGLVATVDNFGANGDRPTHPELLDWLASDFKASGWSIKHTIRRIVTSRVYQLGSDRNSIAEDSDPDNHLLWRANHRRLEAESIRDAILVVSGTLDPEPAVGSVVQSVGDGIIGRNLNTEGFTSGATKRSVYLPIVRGVVPELLKVFDFPEPSMISGSRDVTTVATQALYMMNSEFVTGQAQTFAQRLLAESELNDEQRVDRAWQIALSRSPSETERNDALVFVNQTTESFADSESATGRREKAWTSLAQSLFAAAEFRYVE